jgi:putative acetyltransferase
MFGPAAWSNAMSEKLEIRVSRRDDLAAIESLYPQAFPDEDLLPLVGELLNDASASISLVGTVDARIVGHVIFTKCGVAGTRITAMLLGPLAVAKAWQRQGVGSAIVHAGLRRLEDADVNRVYVLGDPGYYGRFGFMTESSVETPFPLPAEWENAWQSKVLDGTKTPCVGKLTLPPPWLQPALWSQ